MLLTTGVNYNNIFQAAFVYESVFQSISVLNTVCVYNFLTKVKCQKAARKMMFTLTKGWRRYRGRSGQHSLPLAGHCHSQD